MLSFGALRISEDEAAATKTRTQRRDDAAPSQYASVACPECGTATRARPDGSVLCASCVQATQGDWRTLLEAHVERYPKVLSFARCPECERVLATNPPAANRWEAAGHESEVLLALLLRRVRHALLGKRAVSAVEGLSRALRQGSLEVEDARFVWTEPHSRRVCLEVVVAHLSSLPKTQHKCRLTFHEERKRCEDCAGESSSHGRKMGSGGGEFAAKIQVRVSKKRGTGGERTLRALEEALPKTSANSTATAARRVARSHNGFDVEFSSRQDAAKFLQELRRLGRAPLKYADDSKKLVTHDANSSTSEWQRTTLISLPPIDKHDVVVLDDNSFALVLHVRATLRLVDLVTETERDVTAEQYFKKPFDAVLSTSQLIPFHVVDDGVARRKDGDGDCRRYVAPFECRPGLDYDGYDLDTVAHRVHLPHAVPRVVLVNKPSAASSKKKQKKAEHRGVSDEEPVVLPPAGEGEEGGGTQQAQENASPPSAVVDDTPRVLSRKERRHKQKKERQQQRRRQGAVSDDPSAAAAAPPADEEDASVLS